MKKIIVFLLLFTTFSFSESEYWEGLFGYMVMKDFTFEEFEYGLVNTEGYVSQGVAENVPGTNGYINVYNNPNGKQCFILFELLDEENMYVEDNRNCEGNFSGKYKYIRKMIKNDLKPFDRLK